MKKEEKKYLIRVEVEGSALPHWGCYDGSWKTWFEREANPAELKPMAYGKALAGAQELSMRLSEGYSQKWSKYYQKNTVVEIVEAKKALAPLRAKYWVRFTTAAERGKSGYHFLERVEVLRGSAKDAAKASRGKRNRFEVVADPKKVGDEDVLELMGLAKAHRGEKAVFWRVLRGSGTVKEEGSYGI